MTQIAMGCAALTGRRGGTWRLLGWWVAVGGLWWAGIAQATEAPARPTYVDPKTVKTWMDRGVPVTFLDVRDADEFVAGHMPGAINILFEHVDEIAHQLPHDHPIVLYCIHSAHRAPAAAKTLQALGFDNVYVLEGGLVAWRTSGQTIHASDHTKSPTILPMTDRCATKETL